MAQVAPSPTFRHMDPLRPANMRRSAPPTRQAHHNAGDEDDDVPLAKAIPTALQAQKTIRVTPRPRTTSSPSVRRPRTADKPPPTPTREYTRENAGTRASDSPRTPTTATQPSFDELTRQLQALSPKPVTESSRRSGGLPRRPTDERPKFASRHGTTSGHSLSTESTSHVSEESSHQHRQGTPLRSQTQKVPSRTPPHRSNRYDASKMHQPHGGDTQARPAGALASTFNGPSPRPPISPASKTRPPSWVDASEWSRPSQAECPPLQPVTRSHTTKSRPSSPQPRPSLPSIPSLTNFRHPSPYSSPLPSPTTLTPERPKLDWNKPVQMSPGTAAYKEEVLAAADIAEEQRIFVETKQKYCKVKIGVKTRARDVINAVAATGRLKGPNSDERAIGGWMVYDVANDFGMERPIREYELISDVLTTWNKEMRVNYLMIKRSGLRGALSFKHIPNSSPIHEGTVRFEVKKGKWSKRHLKLREHSLFLSKKDSGKDEVLLCSLANFDGYYVTNQRRPPKPFVFAVRSTDNLSMFENPSDSMHIFSCNPAEGERWIEKIMVARSYILYQERTTLFSSENRPLQSSYTQSPLPAYQEPEYRQSLETSPHYQTPKRPRPSAAAITTPERPSTSGGYPPVAKPRPSDGGRSTSYNSSRYGPRHRVPLNGPLITVNATPFAEGSLLAKASATPA